MPRGLYVDRPQNVVIREFDEGALQDNQVRLQAEFAAMDILGDPSEAVKLGIRF